MATTLYGIRNCDTVKKARKWLDGHDIAYQFHDVRDDGLAPGQLKAWVQALGWEQVLNRRSTSWRALADDDKQNINERLAIKLMQAQPTLIKRPVLKHQNNFFVGFKETDYKSIFK